MEYTNNNGWCEITCPSEKRKTKMREQGRFMYRQINMSKHKNVSSFTTLDYSGLRYSANPSKLK